MTSPLNFEDLLYMAKGNAIKGEKKIKQQSQISLNKPKKLDAKEKKLSEGVQKFLQQKAEEEKRQAEAKRLQKEKLLEIRSHDKKANKRVNSMLRMTKSANKACIADAKNSFSDALAEQGDEQQPDEDDYGYVSQSSQEWHKKLLDKYKQIPASKPGVRRAPANIPVAQSLSKSKSGHTDDAEHGEKSHKDKQSTDNCFNNQNNDSNNNKKKKRPPPPDPMNFQELLELANKKAQEPISFCKPLKPTAHVEKETFEFGRPMTKKEKEAYLQEKAFRDKIQSGNITLPPPNSSKSSSSAATGKQSQSQTIPSKAEFKIPSLRKKEAPTISVKSEPPSENRPVIKKPSSKPPPSPPRTAKQPPPPPIPKPSISTPPPRRRSPPPPSKRREMDKEDRPMIKKPYSKPPPSPPPPPSSRRKQSSLKPTHSAPPPRRRSPPPPSSNSKMQASNSSKMPTSNRNMQNSSKTPPFKNNNNSVRMQPPPLPRHLPPQRPKQRPPQKRPHVIDSDEEEYDSEMDDFIADDEEEEINYSDMIRALTGYDRTKYKNEKDDDIQESSVYEQWMEERYSARIGKQEDEQEKGIRC